MDAGESTYGQALAFFDGRPGALRLYESFVERALQMFPATDIQVKKTQISLYDRRMYGCVSMMRAKRKAELPDEYLVVTLGFPDALASDRVAQQVEVRPGRWTVHIVVGSERELDDELFFWLAESHAFSTSR